MFRHVLTLVPAAANNALHGSHDTCEDALAAAQHKVVN